MKYQYDTDAPVENGQKEGQPMITEIKLQLSEAEHYILFEIHWVWPYNVWQIDEDALCYVTWKISAAENNSA